MSENYPPPVQAPAGPTSQTNVLAIISLIAGILGVPTAGLGSLVAIITGHIAQSQIKKGGGFVTGKGLATAGLILGYLGIALGICLVCVLVILPLLGLSLIPWDTFNYTYSY